MSSHLQRLLSALRSQPGTAARLPTVPVEQVASCVDALFPDPGGTARTALALPPPAPRTGRPVGGRHRYENVHAVSPGWLDALAVLELARHADLSARDTPHIVFEREVAAHLLSVGRFPANPQAAELVAAVLQRWRELGGGGSASSSATSPYTFPPSLPPAGCRRLTYLLSLRSPAGHPRAWEEALALYHHLTQQHTAATEGAAGVPVATAADMSAVRHTTLVTLLRSEQWAQALRFFWHAARQRDAPDAVSTGFLIQALGRAGRTEEVEQVYTLCVRLALAQARRGGQSPATTLKAQKRWGTTLSMAMAAVAEHHPERVAPMLEQLLVQSSGAEAGPLVRLDGHFLAAVQQVPGLPERQRLLERARQAHMLDFFKLIRGLVAKGHVEEALRVFAEGVAAHPPLLSRKEIGSARLFLLNGASLDRVERVAAALHTALGRAVHPLRMNDAEVEAVLAKSVATANATKTVSAAAARRSYEKFCLAIMQENYGPYMRGEPHPRRRPSLAALSFLMRNRSLPWGVALDLVGRLDGLPETHARRPMDDGPSDDRRGAQHGRRPVPPVVLLLNAAADLLHSQGQPARAVEVAARAAQTQGGSPAAASLLRADPAALRELLLRGSAHVDARVLHHLLRTATPATEPPPALPRALEVLSLVMERACPSWPRWLPQGSVLPAAVTAKGPSWLTAAPASVHCEALACIRRCVPDAAWRWQLTASYLSFLALPPSGPAPSAGGGASEPSKGGSSHPVRLDTLTTHYAAMWEAVVTLVGLPAGTTALEPPSGEEDGRLRAAEEVLAAATTRCDFLPPAHMLLANQMDRLLPPPSVPHATTHMAGADVEERYLRCAVAQALVMAGWQLAEQRWRGGGRVEPVAVHGLLKLCCRVGEHAAVVSPAERARLAGRLGGAALAVGGLPGIAARLVECQAAHNGLHTVSRQSLHLLYSVCAATAAEGEAGAGGGGRRALQATQRLLTLAAGSEREEHTGRCSPSAPVLPAHYTQFRKLFGWEMGLRMWYETFPKDVLIGVAHSPAAVNYCLSLDDRG